MKSYLQEKGGVSERESYQMWVAVPEGMSFSEFYPI